MKKIKSFLFNPYFILFFINVIFFLPLFFPHLKIIITPEYGGGDENIFHYPIKYLYQQKLKKGQFYFWSEKIGGGYPIYAQGEVGFFDPINLLTLYIFPFFTAINWQIFIYFLIMLWGSYNLGQRLRFSSLFSFFFSITFSYSFFNIANIIHLSHLSSFCYIPFIFSYFLKLYQTKSKKNIDYYVFIIFLFIQFLSGHPQYFFYSILLMFLYLLVDCFLLKKQRRSILKFFLLTFFLISISLLLASFQLLPSVEYYQYTTREIFTNKIQSGNSLSLNYLFTFFYPFVNYNHNLILRDKNNILVPPWDGNLFLGISGIMVIYFLIFRLKDIWVFFYKEKRLFILLTIFLLLAFGKNSPFYFINEIPPFSSFRVPSRLSFLINLLLSIIVVLILKNIFFNKKNNHKIWILIVFQFLISFLFMYNFHLLTEPKNLLKKNQIIEFLENNQNKKYFSLFAYEEYLPYILYKKGINRKKNSYLNYLKFTLPQNFGLLYNLQTINQPASATNLRRQENLYQLLLDPDEDSHDRIETKTASLSAQASSLLSLLRIDYLISPYQLKNINKNYQLFAKYNVDNNLSTYLYQLKNNDRPAKRVVFYNKYQKVITLEEFKSYLINQNLKDKDIVIIENDLSLNNPINLQKKAQIKIIYNNDDHIKILINNKQNGVLVFLNNYFPGWRAYINGNQTEIFRANLLYQGINLNKGKNIVEFKFVPEKFYLGVKISLITLVLLTIVYLRQLLL